MSTMSEPSDAEIAQRCNAMLLKLEDGKSPDSNEIKFLVSTDTVSRNMRNPDNGPIGRFAAKMMEQINLKQCVGSAEKCDIQPGETVLEIGTGGHGYAMEVFLKTKGLKNLIGIEISDKLRNEVETKFSNSIDRKELTLIGTDCKDLTNIFPNDNMVDCILAVNVVYFLHPLKEYLKEMYRVLKPCTGRILLSCKENVRNTGKDSTIFRNMDFDHVAMECKEVGFSVDIENTHFVENPIMNDYVLIKLHKK